MPGLLQLTASQKNSRPRVQVVGRQGGHWSRKRSRHLAGLELNAIQEQQRTAVDEDVIVDGILAALRDQGVAASPDQPFMEAGVDSLGEHGSVSLNRRG